MVDFLQTMRIFVLTIQMLYFSTLYGDSYHSSFQIPTPLCDSRNNGVSNPTGTECNSHLSLVQIVFRHGDRAPIFTFPTDKYTDVESIWSVGRGELTKIGVQQHYQLGRYFRERYKDLLNTNYTRDVVHAMSSDVDRCILSCQSFLAGLFDNYGGKECLDGRVNFPVHSISPESDNVRKFYERTTFSAAHILILHFTKKCTAYNTELIKMSEMLKHQYSCNDKKLFSYLSASTGTTIFTWRDVYKLYDTLFIQELYNLKLPEWTKSVYGNDGNVLKHLAHKSTNIIVSTKRLQELRGGPLLNLMLNRIHLRQINNNTRTKMYLYSGHESTIVTLQSALGIFQSHIPPYASSLIMELHSVSQQCGIHKDFLKIYYKNDSIRDSYEMKIPGCGDPCYVHNLQQNKARFLLGDWNAHCENNDSMLNCHNWLFSK